MKVKKAVSGGGPLTPATAADTHITRLVCPVAFQTCVFLVYTMSYYHLAHSINKACTHGPFDLKVCSWVYNSKHLP